MKRPLGSEHESRNETPEIATGVDASETTERAVFQSANTGYEVYTARRVPDLFETASSTDGWVNVGQGSLEAHCSATAGAYSRVSGPFMANNVGGDTGRYIVDLVARDVPHNACAMALCGHHGAGRTDGVFYDWQANEFAVADGAGTILDSVAATLDTYEGIHFRFITDMDNGVTDIIVGSANGVSTYQLNAAHRPGHKTHTYVESDGTGDHQLDVTYARFARDAGVSVE